MYSKNSNNISYESKNLFEKEFKSTKRTYWTVGMLLRFIIALIGIMNFTNTISYRNYYTKYMLQIYKQIKHNRKIKRNRIDVFYNCCLN